MQCKHNSWVHLHEGTYFEDGYVSDLLYYAFQVFLEIHELFFRRLESRALRDAFQILAALCHAYL